MSEYVRDAVDEKIKKDLNKLRERMRHVGPWMASGKQLAKIFLRISRTMALRVGEIQ